jgi:hypothetical protein
MGAVTITINTPPDGSGSVWNCATVDGTTTDCAQGSPVSGILSKWNGSTWISASPLGPLALTATNNNTWSTAPDTTLGVGTTFSSSGNYRVRATVMDNATMTSDLDENFWTIP